MTQSKINISLANEITGWVPLPSAIESWITQTFQYHDTVITPYHINIRIVSADVSQRINKEFRGIDKPTNILSFPYDLSSTHTEESIADLLICHPLISSEAHDLSIPICDHWAHLIVHGTLHLLGYTHDTDEAANIMEKIEIDILQSRSIPSPY